MLARLARELPPGDFAYEPKWDGFRCLVFAEAGAVDLRSRHGRPFARYFPELTEAIAALPRPAVLDGEIVVPREGGLAFEPLLARLHPSPSRVARLARETPAAIVLFELLAEGAEDLRPRPLVERRARLESLLGGAPDHARHGRRGDRARLARPTDRLRDRRGRREAARPAVRGGAARLGEGEARADRGLRRRGLPDVRGRARPRRVAPPRPVGPGRRARPRRRLIVLPGRRAAGAVRAAPPARGAARGPPVGARVQRRREPGRAARRLRGTLGSRGDVARLVGDRPRARGGGRLRPARWAALPAPGALRPVAARPRAALLRARAARPSQLPMSPVIGDDAAAWSFIGMRPARNALRPPSIPARIASAMRTGSFASAIAVFMRTATAPSSIARAASLAVPTPASTRTGIFTVSMMIRRLYGFRRPRPEPIGAPSGITAAHPASSSFFAVTGSSFVYGRTVKPSFASTRDASTSPSTSGKSVRRSPITSSFTRSPISSSRPSRAVRIASSAVKQAAVFGRSLIPFGIHSRSDSDPFFERSSRRTATVTTSAPEATSARCIVGKSGYLPVPTRSRLVNWCLPMLHASAMAYPPPTNATISTESPGPSRWASYRSFVTTVSFTSTATRGAFTPRWTSRPATEVPSGISRSSPFSRTCMMEG